MKIEIRVECTELIDLHTDGVYSDIRLEDVFKRKPDKHNHFYSKWSITLYSCLKTLSPNYGKLTIFNFMKTDFP
ncbi:hypothetical protein T10_8022 [Trichinella papuae]|uniref:Uncharacterized protein n=1 Tax=Trichinella papuae TaxID=268474 RepID=A0A0V1MFX6_9BILA|nr:hypothetical protein T10_8022 [Trichinella papuae]